MSDPRITTTVGLANFGIGCIGAIAPEALRLYNLRTQPVLRWSGTYLMFSIPFIFIGGFVSWVLEPTTRWAAFYTGLTAPVLLTTAMRDVAKAQKELVSTQTEIKELEQKLGATTEQRNQLATEIAKLLLTIERLEAARSSTVNPTEYTVQPEAEHKRMQSEALIRQMALKQTDVNLDDGWVYSHPSYSPMSSLHRLLTSAVIFGLVAAIFMSPTNVLLLLVVGAFAVVLIAAITQFLHGNRSFQEFLKGL
jgi:hypothetical protein